MQRFQCISATRHAHGFALRRRAGSRLSRVMSGYAGPLLVVAAAGCAMQAVAVGAAGQHSSPSAPVGRTAGANHQQTVVTAALDRAPLEIIGVPGGSTTVSVPGSRHVITLTEVRVDQVVRGSVQERSITVQRQGGTLSDGRGEVVSHQPLLPPGVRTTMYLSRANNGRYAVVAGELGAVPVTASNHQLTASCDAGDIPGNDYCLEPYHYTAGDLPVAYSVDTAGGPSGALQTVQQSFGAWSSASGMRWTYTAGGAAAGVNPVSFGALPAGVLGETDVFTTGSHIDSFTLVITNDLQGVVLSSVATHEAGHALGVGHINNDPTQVMFPSVGPGVVKTIGQGDAAGAQALYGPGPGGASAGATPSPAPAATPSPAPTSTPGAPSPVPSSTPAAPTPVPASTPGAPSSPVPTRTPRPRTRPTPVATPVPVGPPAVSVPSVPPTTPGGAGGFGGISIGSSDPQLAALLQQLLLLLEQYFNAPA